MSSQVMLQRAVKAIGNRRDLPYMAYKAYKSYYNSGKGAKRKRVNRQIKSYRRPIIKNNKQIKSLKGQVRQLKKIAESDQGTHIYRWREAGYQVCAIHGSAFKSDQHFYINDLTKLASAIESLRYYNPSVPGTLVTADGNTGTYQRDFYFKRSYSKIMVRNNYQVPVNVTLYLFRVKESTSINPQDAFTNGLADIGNPSASSCLVYPTDSQELKDLYKIEKTKSVYLQPGSQIQMTASFKPFQFDPSFVDDHTSNFQKAYGGGSFACRISGALGHDTISTGAQGSLAAAIDYQVDNTFEIIYAAGADIKTVEVEDNSISTFANLGVLCNKAAADLQPWSQA